VRVSARASQRGVTRSLRLLAHYIAMGKTRIRYLAAVFLLLGIIIGGALVLLLRSLIHQPSPEIAKVTQAIQELEAAQRKATDQFQAIQQMLDAEKAQVKQLSGQIDLDGLLCCADERLSDLAISASYDLTPARRSHAPQPAAPIITVCFAGRLVVVPPRPKVGCDLSSGVGPAQGLITSVPKNPSLHLLPTGRVTTGFSGVRWICSVSCRIVSALPSRSAYSTLSRPISTSSNWPRYVKGNRNIPLS